MWDTLRNDWAYLRAHGIAWRALYPMVVWMTMVAILMGLCMGCTPKQDTMQGTTVEQHIKQAEAWMSNHAMKLVYPGDWTPEFKLEYEHHHRWIEARDAIHRAEVEGRDE